MANRNNIDINRILANLLSQGAKASTKTPTPVGVGASLGQNKDFQNLLGALAKVNPLAIGNALASEEILPSTEEPKPGPNEKLALAEEIRRKKPQVADAFNQVPPGQVIQQARFLDQQETQRQNLLNQRPGQSGQQPTQQQDQQGSSTLNRLLFSLGVGLTAAGGGDTSGLLNLAGKRLEAQTELAKETRATRIKEQDRVQKIEDEFFKNVLTVKPLAGDSAKQFNFANEANIATTQLKEILTKLGPKQIRQIANPGNLVGQRIKTLIDKIKAELSPARGGANLSIQELKLIQGLIPKRGLAGLAENPEETIFKLDSILGSTSRLITAIRPNAKLRSFIQSELRSGTSRAEIAEGLRKRGFL